MVKVALVYDCRAELLMDAFACPAVYTQQQQLTYIGVECSVRVQTTLSFFSFFKDKMENPSAPWLQRSRETHHSWGGYTDDVISIKK